MIKKITTILLSILLLIPAFGYFSALEIKADSGEYVVKYIEDNGSLSTVDSYSTLDNAMKKMKENDDYVVTHSNSLSPMKIIAMNSGFAYSYPYRSGRVTMNLYERVNSALVGEGVTTYLTEHYEMTYHSTYSYYPSKGFGWIEVTMNGFHGYADLENTDLVPMKYVKNGLSITLGGNDRTGQGEQAFNVICKQNYYINDNGELKFVYHRAWPRNNSSGACIENTLAYGKAPAIMKSGKKYYSNDGIHFFLKPSLTGDYITYYNYYQFLPLRTKTNITADQMNAFINANNNSGIIAGKAQSFISAQEKHGCNAATILAMAIHESAWGTSNIARGKNNLFGWGAYDSATSNATTYSSVEACVSAQMGDNLANYMDPNCSRYFSMSLGNKGGGFITKYASDPYWAEKIASYYYRLDKSCNFKDFESYKMAVVNTNNAAVYKETNTSVKLYGVANKSGYQKNVIVTPLGDEENGIYKTYTSVPSGYCNNDLPQYQNSDGVTFPIKIPVLGTLVDYDFDMCFGYMKAGDIEIVQANETSGHATGGEEQEKEIIIIDPQNLKPMMLTKEFKIDGNILSVEGCGLIQYVDFTNPEVIKHQLVFKNVKNFDEEYTYDLTTIEKKLELYDQYTYNYVYFEGKSIDISELPLGSYIAFLRITNDIYTTDISFRDSDDEYRNMVVKDENGITSRIFSDSAYSYRFELSKISTPIDYSKINKPKIRESFLSIKSISISDDLKLSIQGTAFAHGLDFGENNNVSYALYFVANNEDYKKYDLTTTATNEQYVKSIKTALKTTNDLSYSSFTGEFDISEVFGDYDLIFEIKTTNAGVEYIDYICLTAEDIDLPNVEKDGNIYKIYSLELKNRLIYSSNSSEIKEENKENSINSSEVNEGE